MEPSVTVGIPFYNAERTLADAIRSVFAQTLADWELILVDDGSTDGSLKIARSVDDARVRVVSDVRNLGLAARLNQIAQLARGRYLARMDADDIMSSLRLAIQSGYLDNNPAVDVVGTGMCILDTNLRPVAKRLPSSTPLSARRVLAGAGLMHATVMGRTAWFRRNPFDPHLRRAQDFELWCRTYGQSHFASLPDCHYFCAEHASFALPKYARSAWSVARVQREHGVRLIGYLPVFALRVRQLAKVVAYTAARAVGAQGLLIAHRSTVLSPTEIAQATAEVARIRSTPLPFRPSAVAASSARTPCPSPAHVGRGISELPRARSGANMTRPLVTVGIPFYNPGVALRAAIKSILSQSYENIELLVVNDGSTDGSVQIAHEFSDVRIRYHGDGVNRGFIPRLNQIIDLAKGEYIARMDADDISHPRRIERQVEYLNTHPSVDVVGTDMYVIDRRGRVLGVLAMTGTPDELTSVTRTALSHATVMGRRGWWQSNKYDAVYRRAEDKELFARAAARSTYASIPEPLYYYDFKIRLRPFLESYLSDIRVVSIYGPGRLGLRSTAVTVATYLLKAATLPLLFACGRESVIVERNLRRIDGAEVLSANQVLQNIMRDVVHNSREQ